MSDENTVSNDSVDAFLARDADKEGGGEGANPADLAIDTTSITAASYAEALRAARAQR